MCLFWEKCLPLTRLRTYIGSQCFVDDMGAVDVPTTSNSSPPSTTFALVMMMMMIIIMIDGSVF